MKLAYSSQLCSPVNRAPGSVVTADTTATIKTGALNGSARPPIAETMVATIPHANPRPAPYSTEILGHRGTVLLMPSSEHRGRSDPSSLDATLTQTSRGLTG
jgi:hypothetical protein